MDGLHEDIITEILLRVPASSLMRLKRTNKRWHAIISHPTFVNLHVERSRKDPASPKILKFDPMYYSGGTRPVKPVLIDPENLKRGIRLRDPTRSFPPITRASIRGTCDGLVCLVLSADCSGTSPGACGDIICLWNPITGDVRELPNLLNSAPSTNWWSPLRVGLGYDRVTDDYKVVALARAKVFDVSNMTPVYTCARKTSTWERVAAIPEMDFSYSSFYLKGYVHWEARRSRGADTRPGILSYCFAKEEFQEVPLPKDFPNWVWPTIGILDGCLCVYTSSIPSIDEHIEAWIMKEYGVETSLAKMFKISTATIPVGPAGIVLSVQLLTLKYGNVLLIVESDSNYQTPFLYDLEEKWLYDLQPDVPRWCSISTFRVYEESLVSPYSCVDGCKLEQAVTSPSCRGPLQPLGR